eukprot:TRINITY_DN5284_c0_g1_i4.p1 TRINITY_DN5284_c0_g1~~TRINITY_DN5284_c0_g1_i4.p1  ORF type:complete len:148 (+),score=7.46 TRINITY_DN5284_c0_g1_i4:94-537(+)
MDIISNISRYNFKLVLPLTVAARVLGFWLGFVTAACALCGLYFTNWLSTPGRALSWTTIISFILSGFFGSGSIRRLEWTKNDLYLGQAATIGSAAVGAAFLTLIHNSSDAILAFILSLVVGFWAAWVAPLCVAEPPEPAHLDSIDSK